MKKYIALTSIGLALLLNNHIIVYNGLNKGIVFHSDYIYCGIEIVPTLAPFCGDY